MLSIMNVFPSVLSMLVALLPTAPSPSTLRFPRSLLQASSASRVPLAQSSYDSQLYRAPVVQLILCKLAGSADNITVTVVGTVVDDFSANLVLRIAEMYEASQSACTQTKAIGM